MMSGRPDAMRTETRLVQALGAGGDAEVQLFLHNAYSGNSIRLRRIANTGPSVAVAPAPQDAAAAVDPQSASVEPDSAESGNGADVPDAEASGSEPSPMLVVDEPPRPESNGEPIVRGSVFYRERIAMPEGSVVTVRLLDTSRAGAPAEVIGEQVISGPDNVPVAFAIGYEPSDIDATHSYAVAAQIDVNGQLAWRSTIHHPVLTRGAGASAVVMVTRAG
jgi:putative lipoprotein